VDVDTLQQVTKAPDVSESFNHWLAEAQVRDDIYYFAILVRGAPVGQILLHDTNRVTGESLVAYHLFDPGIRRHGIGTQALGLLQRFVASAMALKKLVIITSRDNVASQHIALKCGFMHVGVPREDPINGLVLTWDVPRRTVEESNDRFRHQGQI
jgi:RimJ/RimL family protein N-acetyltransferase